MSSEKRSCPDGGACHHGCGIVCWRVQACGPLSGVFPGDRWPAEIAAANTDRSQRPAGRTFLAGLTGIYDDGDGDGWDRVPDHGDPEGMTPARPPASRGKCVEPGHWIIGGRRVRAVYQGRSRAIMGWNIEPADGDDRPPARGFLFLNDVREWIRNQDQEPGQETVMSSTVIITLDPETEGISAGSWETWARDHGLVQNPGNGMFYAGDGSARVEAGYAAHCVTFATFHMGPGLPAVAELALELWAATGGALSASPELARIIALRYAGAGVLMETAAKLQRETS